MRDDNNNNSNAIDLNKSNEGQKKDSAKLKWSMYCVWALCFVQCLLIIVVTVIIICSHCRNSNGYKSFGGRIANVVENERSELKELELQLTRADSTHQINYALIEQKAYAAAFRDIEESISGIESNLLSSNNYTAIILALITLCATLAVVIPYIVGSSLTKNTVKDYASGIVEETKDRFGKERKEMIEDLEKLMKNADDRIYALEHLKNTRDRIDETVDMLSWAEAHLSRMQAYFLANKNSQDGRTKELFWSIGWASKSLIRYLALSKNDKNRYHKVKFMEDDIKCIVHVQENLQRENIFIDKDSIDVARRSFVDLYDALRLLEKSGTLMTSSIYDEYPKLKATLSFLYALVWSDYERCNENAESALQNLIATKAKHSLYYDEGKESVNSEEYLKQDLEWFVENCICSENWIPVGNS